MRGPDEGFDMPHGYVFEVPVDATGPVDPVPLRAMGRFVHEAVAVDPETGIVYETEDESGGRAGFYRFIPDTPEVLADGGRLQMLAVTDQPGYGTGERPDAGAPCGRCTGLTSPIPRRRVFDQGSGVGRGAIRAARRRLVRGRRDLLRVHERRETRATGRCSTTCPLRWTRAS